MASKYKHRRTSDPTIGFPAKVEAGELVVNTANRKLAVGDADHASLGATKELLGVTIFDPKGNYSVGDLVVHDDGTQNTIWRCIKPHNADTWVNGVAANNWEEAAGGKVIVSDNAPTANLKNGVMWFDSNTGHLYVYLDDGSSQQWVACITPAPGPQLPTNLVTNDAPDQTITGNIDVVGDLKARGHLVPSNYASLTINVDSAAANDTPADPIGGDAFKTLGGAVAWCSGRITATSLTFSIQAGTYAETASIVFPATAASVILASVGGAVRINLANNMQISTKNEIGVYGGDITISGTNYFSGVEKYIVDANGTLTLESRDSARGHVVVIRNVYVSDTGTMIVKSLGVASGAGNGLFIDAMSRLESYGTFTIDMPVGHAISLGVGSVGAFLAGTLNLPDRKVINAIQAASFKGDATITAGFSFVPQANTVTVFNGDLHAKNNVTVGLPASGIKEDAPVNLSADGTNWFNYSGGTGNSNFFINRTTDGFMQWFGDGVKPRANNIGGILRAGNKITLQNATVVPPSDKDLKENIKPLTKALDGVKALQFKSFNYIGNDDYTAGVIAQEAQTVDGISELVRSINDVDGEHKHYGFDYTGLIAYLGAAVQEQQTIIEDLKARIEALESA